MQTAQRTNTKTLNVIHSLRYTLIVVLIIINIFAFLSGFIGVPLAFYFKFYMAIPPLILFSFAWGLFYFLETKLERVMKGIFIIIYGIMWGIFYPKFLASLDSDVVQFQDYLLIFTNLVIFSCSGAGGSLIANHADKSCSDAQSKPREMVVFDKTAQIKLLNTKVDTLTNKISVIQWSLVIIVALLIVLIAI
jgi:hypothetical protein